jgi:type IV pilus assembly protein PilB
MSVRLGEALLSRGLLTLKQLQEGLKYQQQHGGRLGSILVQHGFVSDQDVAEVLSEQYGIPTIDLTNYQIDEVVLDLIPVETAIRYQVVPLKRVGTTLTLAVADPTNVLALDEIKFMTGYRVEPVVASEGSIREAIEEHFGTQQTLELKRVYDELVSEEQEYELDLVEEQDVDVAELQKSSSEAPIIKLVNIVLADAIRKNVSDVHLEPYENEFRIRFRVDGVLYTTMCPPVRLRDSIVSRLKIMSNLDIGERRLPQDGRIRMNIVRNGVRKKIDFRVSTLPTLFGEKVVLRILDPDKLPPGIEELGFDTGALKRFKQAIARPYGMVLVTGPTGSGKTSTLYTCLSRLNTDEVNIMTAEDPVEFNFGGINQVQVSEQIGRTFANVLRSFLRQDPNILMVGEIRDLETAEIAVKAALTGHLVLSTLHTNDAPSSISRLINMGVEPFLVANSVHLLCAQRLIRLICPDCKKEISTPQEALLSLGFTHEQANELRIYRGAGCRNCNDTGYRGRSGLFEVMDVSPAIQELILSGATTPELRRKAQQEGMMTLRDSGLRKVAKGLTTIEEVLRETSIA